MTAQKSNTDRPSDIRLDREPIPAGQFMVEGSFLANTMRPAKIPYGSVTTLKDLPGGQRYVASVGLVFYEEDRDRVNAAIEAKEASKKLRLNYPSQCKKKQHQVS